ncbi:lactose ABC transporter permease [Tepidanaerobacter syntrophicus]|uniref:Lactose/L-arabinose transport system permease protein n=1 Tax=Tepidanaerobacter syntrophicus TaxID=224999 RepID=A0A0U9HMI6_9FIRM|nr:sugar ABC transporter permease [Tepidanaerobacter syntrophicus]GAQ25041.1 lactose/L-arabinose transport system permease protein [Tepidanaerobacter syntrophicus]GLI20264.1 lactose ABC transporter permease [Tepidanaerobacter syntrophicus]GLI51812.1 lactose ABC transporter permease [Tepidanaerobacter syntrophicus]HHV83250.1 sugar ABC transporter permease [Tepidanaerobacter syntrophicus]
MNNTIEKSQPNRRRPRFVGTRWNIKTAPYLFLLPTIIVFCVFMIYPFVSSFFMSFQELEGGKFVYVGLKNYIRLMKDSIFITALKNTTIYLLIQVPIMLVLALVIANMLNQRFLKAKGFFRVSVFLPCVTALVAYALIFKLLLNTEYGLVNYLLTSLGFPKVDWLNGPISAKISLIIALTWRWTGYNTVIMIAGLQRIPEEIYEAADIDGASSFQKFKQITIPLMKPIILFCAITSTIGTLQLFDESYILTHGGPDNATITVVHYLYNMGFRYLKFGYAAAMSYVLLIIVAILSAIQFKISGSDDL